MFSIYVVTENISKLQLRLQYMFASSVEGGQCEEKIDQSQQTLRGATETHEKHTVMQKRTHVSDAISEHNKAF
jgi:hypothetical protein